MNFLEDPKTYKYMDKSYRGSGIRVNLSNLEKIEFHAREQQIQKLKGIQEDHKSMKVDMMHWFKKTRRNERIETEPDLKKEQDEIFFQ